MTTSCRLSLQTTTFHGQQDKEEKKHCKPYKINVSDFLAYIKEKQNTVNDFENKKVHEHKK